jgi:uncharacterized protein DUF481
MHKMGNIPKINNPIWFFLFLSTFLLSTLAFSDEVTSKGTVLQGKVLSFSSSGVNFETVYGKGTISIPWKNIEAIKTEGPFQVLYGKDKEIDAQVQGLTDGKLMIGESAETGTPVEVATIRSGQPIGPAGISFANRMRSRWRFWSGSFSLGFSLSQSTDFTTGLLVGLKLRRAEGPTRFFFESSYRYETEKLSGEDRHTTENDLRALTRFEYDLPRRLYSFVSGDFEHDTVNELTIRQIPKAGIGYKVWEKKIDETKVNLLQVEAGGAWVYEKFSTGETNSYFSIPFGAFARFYLPHDGRFDFRADYLPAINDWINNYLIRGEASLSMPLTKVTSIVASAIEVYDSIPAPGTTKNSLFFTLGVQLNF